MVRIFVENVLHSIFDCRLPIKERERDSNGTENNIAEIREAGIRGTKIDTGRDGETERT